MAASCMAASDGIGKPACASARHRSRA